MASQKFALAVVLMSLLLAGEADKGDEFLSILQNNLSSQCSKILKIFKCSI